MEEQNSFYKVTKNDVFGRYLVAATNIKLGQLIIKENPTVLCPQIGGALICFNCCAELKKLQWCPECSVAILCNQQCRGRYHGPNECSTLKTIPIRREDLIANPEVITPLRCILLRLYNKDLFERLLQLEAHLEARRNSEIWRRIQINVENVLHQMKIIYEDDLKDEVVQKICAVLDINTYEVRQPQRNRVGFNPGESLRGLYLAGALMAHDCVANVHLAVDDDFSLFIHAAVDIPEGCPIFFNYTNVLNGSDERRGQLNDGKHFQCNCSRCVDPTELGTEMSSLKCPRCHKGLIRPKSGDCSSCNRTFHSSLIKTTLVECRRQIDEMQTPDIDKLENLLKKLSLTFHPHHYLVLEIEQNLVRLYAQATPSVKNLRRKIELCNKLLEIFRKIEPGISRIQAIGLYELHSGVANLADKIYNNKEIGKAEFLKMLLLAENTLKNSIRYLLYEPINSPEGRLTQNALSELKLLRVTISNFERREKEIEKTNTKKSNRKKT